MTTPVGARGGGRLRQAVAALALGGAAALIPPDGVAAGPAPGRSPVWAGNSPAVNYRLHCSGCHLEDGTGMPSRGIPPMTGVVGHFLRLPEGRAFLVQVPGVANSSLSDAEIAALTNWVLDAMAGDSLPGPVPPYTADEVTRLRRHGPVDVAAARARIAAQLEADGHALSPAR